MKGACLLSPHVSLLFKYMFLTTDEHKSICAVNSPQGIDFPSTNTY